MRSTCSTIATSVNPPRPFKTADAVRHHKKIHLSKGERLVKRECGVEVVDLARHKHTSCTFDEVTLVYCDDCGYAVNRYDWARHLEESHSASTATRKFVEAAKLVGKGEYTVAIPDHIRDRSPEGYVNKEKERRQSEVRRFVEKAGLDKDGTYAPVAPGPPTIFPERIPRRILEGSRIWY
jgi:hypothetical protein